MLQLLAWSLQIPLEAILAQISGTYARDSLKAGQTTGLRHLGFSGAETQSAQGLLLAFCSGQSGSCRASLHQPDQPAAQARRHATGAPGPQPFRPTPHTVMLIGRLDPGIAPSRPSKDQGRSCWVGESGLSPPRFLRPAPERGPLGQGAGPVARKCTRGTRSGCAHASWPDASGRSGQGPGFPPLGPASWRRTHVSETSLLLEPVPPGSSQPPRPGGWRGRDQWPRP